MSADSKTPAGERKSQQAAGSQGRKAGPAWREEGGPGPGACWEPCRVSSRTQVPPNPSSHKEAWAKHGSSRADVRHAGAPGNFQGEMAFASGRGSGHSGNPFP